jgi:predicted DNA binding protein
MGLIAEFSVSSPELALSEATTAVPAVTLELTDILATDPQRPQLTFWAFGNDESDVAAFDRALAEDWTATNIETHTNLEDRRLYRVQLSEDVEVVCYPNWVAAGASQLSTSCQDGVWRNRLRFPDRESFDEVRTWCVDRDLSFQLHRLYTEARPDETNGTGLSPKQAQTARRAYEAGYYDFPRESATKVIGEDLDISAQAVSERLRRAHAALIEEYLLDETGRQGESE